MLMLGALAVSTIFGSRTMLFETSFLDKNPAHFGQHGDGREKLLFRLAQARKNSLCSTKWFAEGAELLKLAPGLKLNPNVRVLVYPLHVTVMLRPPLNAQMARWRNRTSYMCTVLGSGKGSNQRSKLSCCQWVASDTVVRADSLWYRPLCRCLIPAVSIRCIRFPSSRLSTMINDQPKPAAQVASVTLWCWWLYLCVGSQKTG
jgi:hypothetical protein